MYVKIKEGKIDRYPYSFEDLRRDNPHKSFNANTPLAVLEEHGVYVVKHEETPVFNSLTHRIQVSSIPKLVNNEWVLVKELVELDEKEQEAKLEELTVKAKEQRNKLLAATDWLALTDNTMSPEMAAYRQALRNISKQDGFPINIIWPEKPE